MKKIIFTLLTIIIILGCSANSKKYLKEYQKEFELKYPEVYNEHFLDGIDMNIENFTSKLLQIENVKYTIYNYDNDNYHILFIECDGRIINYEITIKKQDEKIYSSRFIGNSINDYFNIIDSDLQEYEYWDFGYKGPDDNNKYLYYSIYGTRVSSSGLPEYYNYNVDFLCIDKIINRIVITNSYATP